MINLNTEAIAIVSYMNAGYHSVEAQIAYVEDTLKIITGNAFRDGYETKEKHEKEIDHG